MRNVTPCSPHTHSPNCIPCFFGFFLLSVVLWFLVFSLRCFCLVGASLVSDEHVLSLLVIFFSFFGFPAKFFLNKLLYCKRASPLRSVGFFPSHLRYFLFLCMLSPLSYTHFSRSTYCTKPPYLRCRNKSFFPPPLFPVPNAYMLVAIPDLADNLTVHTLSSS